MRGSHQAVTVPARFQNRAAVRRIRAAADAAPKPLSMLQTVMPEAQLASIQPSAVNPPNAAPYPTEVGTAITGMETRPPMTLGSAPSMPATTMARETWLNSSRRLRSR